MNVLQSQLSWGRGTEVRSKEKKKKGKIAKSKEISRKLKVAKKNMGKEQSGLKEGEEKQWADAAGSRQVTNRCANKAYNHLSIMENSHPGSASGSATQRIGLTQQGESAWMAEIQLSR